MSHEKSTAPVATLEVQETPQATPIRFSERKKRMNQGLEGVADIFALTAPDNLTPKANNDTMPSEICPGTVDHI